MKLTTIIPVYNVGKYIRTGLESMLVQGMCEGEHEVLLIDDGSTDGSGRICDEYAAKYPTIFRVFHKPNGGVSSARNLGIREAKGEYIHFMDADDWMDANSYRILIDATYDCGADYVGFLNKSIDAVFEAVKPKIEDCGVKTVDIIAVCDGVELILSNKMWTTVWSYLVKKSFLIKNDLTFNESMIVGEDQLFSCQGAIESQKIVLTNARIYNYYSRPGSAVTSFSQARFRPWVDSMVCNLVGFREIGERHNVVAAKMDVRIDDLIGWMMAKFLRFKINYKDSRYACKEFNRIGVLPTSGRTMVLRAANFFLMHPSLLPMSSWLYRNIFYKFVYPLSRAWIRKKYG